MRRLLALLPAALLAGCVVPAPPAGAPVPTLLPAVEGTGTVAGTVVVRVEAQDFSPDSVALHVDDLHAPGRDADPPYRLELDTTKLPDGAHRLLAVGSDGERVVVDATPVRVDNRTYDFSAVTTRLQGVVDPLPGVALRVAHHGRRVYDRAFGTYTAGTQVATASAVKWLTAATVMTLVDDGLVGLDTPISSYLPGFGGAKAGVTLRRLLSFTSGLEDEPACIGSRTLTLEQCVAQIAAAPLKAAVGAEFRYGAGHLAVAARVAEVRAGKPWTTLFAERMAGPLGLTRTTYNNPPNPNVAGGARTTLDDYERFVRMLWNFGELNGVRVLSRTAVAEMQRDQTGGAPIVVASAARKALGSRYGFGEWYDVLGGSYEVSSSGAFGFHPWIDRSRDAYGVYVVEDRGDGGGASGFAVKNDVRSAIDAAGG